MPFTLFSWTNQRGEQPLDLGVLGALLFSFAESGVEVGGIYGKELEE